MGRTISVPVLLLAATLPLALAGCGPKAPDQSAAPTVEGTSAAEVSTDWTAENPTDPAVPVQLPTTRMTNQSVPAPSGQ
jgi:hypothetical protein